MLTLNDYERLEALPKAGSPEDPLLDLRSKIPPGKSGKWEVSKFNIEPDLGLLRAMRDGRGTYLGEYTRLTRNNTCVMSDTNAELDDLGVFFAALDRTEARSVLINGLGLGIALQGALRSSRINRIVVVEIAKEVIDLVGPHFNHPKVEIVHGDAYTHKIPCHYDVVWHDIWDNVPNSDNKNEIRRLRRRHGGKCYWQGVWCEWGTRR